MAGFGDRLAAMKKAQEGAEEKKRQEAVEAANREREAKLDSLTKRRETVAAELSQAESEAAEASKAVGEAESFAKEQGENLDSGAKAEIDAIKQEAAQVMQKFETLKSEVAQIDAEIGSLSEEAPPTAETAKATEAPAEKPAAEVPAAVEAAPAEAAGAEKPAGAEPESPEEAFKKANEAFGEAQKSLRETLKALNIDKLTPEQAKTALGEIKTARLALLRSFNDVAGKLPLKDGKMNLTAINSTVEKTFGDSNPDSVFNSANEAIDSLSRKINGVKKPQYDTVITQRGWEDSSKFSEAEYDELVKLEGYQVEQSVSRGVEAPLAALWSAQHFRASRLDEAALQKHKARVQKVIGEVPAKHRASETDARFGRLTATDKSIREAEAGISLAERHWKEKQAKPE